MIFFLLFCFISKKNNLNAFTLSLHKKENFVTGKFKQTIVKIKNV